MTQVWLSPGLPVDHQAVGDALGSEYELLPPSLYAPSAAAGGSSGNPTDGDGPGDSADGTPAGGAATAAGSAGGSGEPAPAEPAILVVTGFEDDLLRALGGRPPEHALVVVTPPGGDFPAELRRDSRPDLVGPAASVAEVAALVRAAAVRSPALAWADTPWAAAGQVAVLGAAAGPPAASTGRRRFGSGRLPRRTGLLIAGVAAGLVLLAGGTALGLVLADGDSDSDSSRIPVALRVPANGDRFDQAPFDRARPYFGNSLPDAGPLPFAPRRWWSEEESEQFKQCMADNGVPLDDENLWEQGQGEMGTQLRDALRECLPQRDESGDETS